ncbi:MAG: radical SAM protein, partial [Betaproteobacteria bacterium]|nr:radical SAM protein [Betaproteobacteria bacterium]
MSNRRILFVKPPDRFLDDEFVYQQLGPHYLQSFLEEKGLCSDLLVLYESPDVRQARTEGLADPADLSLLCGLFLGHDGASTDLPFDLDLFGNYDVVGMSVMTPQAPDAYQLNSLIRNAFPHILTVIGGSHARYYQDRVSKLPSEIAFDFIVPHDGWQPMFEIATGLAPSDAGSIILSHQEKTLTDLPAPTRPAHLMERYNFSIAGVPAYHTVTALGCPFTCHFCESGIESVRTFSPSMIDRDLERMSAVHDQLGHQQKAVMFFDDVGLMSPKQVARLSELVSHHGFNTWRAFTHAYLVVKHGATLLEPFINSGGKRVGIGIETGSQRSLDLINKRNGKKQLVSEHYEAIQIANDLGIAVDAFTMIYPWEDHSDLEDTTRLVEFVASNPVNGIDAVGRPLRNNVDSTI